MSLFAGYIVSSGGQTKNSIGGVAIVVKDTGLKASHRRMTHVWATSPIACCDVAWYHLVVTWDSVTTKLYVNGSLTQTATSVTSIQYDLMILSLRPPTTQRDRV